MTFEDYIGRIRSLYDGEGFVLALHPGAGARMLAAVEGRIGCRLDQGLREAWAAADGGDDGLPVFCRPGYLTAYDFLSVDDALSERDAMQRRSPRYSGYEDPEPRDPRIRPGWFQDGWLPFAGFGGGTLLLIQDYSPSDAGRPGQVISFTHDPDRIEYVAPDFASFLSASLASAIAETEDFFIGLEV